MAGFRLRLRGGVVPPSGLAVSFGAKTRQGYGGLPTAETPSTALTGAYGAFFKIDEAGYLVPAASGSFTYGSAWTPPVASGTVSVTGGSGQVYDVTILANAAHIRERTGRSINPDAGTPTNRSELGSVLGNVTPTWVVGGDTIWCRDGHFNPTQYQIFYAPRPLSAFGGRITIRSETVDTTTDVWGWPNRQHGYRMGGVTFVGAGSGTTAAGALDFYQVGFYVNVGEGANVGLIVVNVGQGEQTGFTWNECGFWTGPALNVPTILGSNPLTTTNASATITIAQTAHGYANGTALTVTGATTTNGIAAANINGLRFVTVINANSYSITAGGGASATSSGSGGGAAVGIAIYINNRGIVNAWNGWSVTNSTIDGTSTFFITAPSTSGHVINANVVRHLRNGDFVQTNTNGYDTTLTNNIAFDGQPTDGVSHCDFFQQLGMNDGSTNRFLGTFTGNICVDFDGQGIFEGGSLNSSYTGAIFRNNATCVSNPNALLALSINDVVAEFNTLIMPQASVGGARLGIGSQTGGGGNGAGATLTKNVANTISTTVQAAQLPVVTQTGNVTLSQTTAAYQAVFPGYVATMIDYSLTGIMAQFLPSSGAYAGALAGAGAFKPDGSQNA